MQIGMKIYYDKANGNVILNTGEYIGRGYLETTEDQDFISYKELAQRVRETVGVVKLQYGQYSREFAECNGYRVNPATAEVEFTYPGEEKPNPLISRVAAVEVENASLLLELAKTQGEQEQTGRQLVDMKGRLDQAEAENAALLLKLVEGGVI